MAVEAFANRPPRNKTHLFIGLAKRDPQFRCCQTQKHPSEHPATLQVSPSDRIGHKEGVPATDRHHAGVHPALLPQLRTDTEDRIRSQNLRGLRAEVRR